MQTSSFFSFGLCVSLDFLYERPIIFAMCSISQCPPAPFSLCCLSFLQKGHNIIFSLLLSLFWLSHALLCSSSAPLFPQSTVDKVNLKYSAHPICGNLSYSLIFLSAIMHQQVLIPSSPLRFPLKRLHLQRLWLGMVLHGKHSPAVSQSHQPWENQLLKDQGEKEAAVASSMSPSPWTHDLIWEDSGGYQEDGGEQDPKAQ